MTFSEIRTEVFARLEESSSAPVFWKLSEVNTSINEGYRELSDASEWNESSATLTFITTKLYYNLRTTLTNSFLSLKRIFNVQSDEWLVPVHTRRLDQHDTAQWETSTGDPDKFFMRGGWYLGLTPKPTSSGTAKVWYTELPSALSADSDTPGFPQEFHFGIVEYALYDLFAQEGDTQKALKHWMDYEAYENALSKYVDGRMAKDKIGAF
jgi:hypothetical protein